VASFRDIAVHVAILGTLLTRTVKLKFSIQDNYAECGALEPLQACDLHDLQEMSSMI